MTWLEFVRKSARRWSSAGSITGLTRTDYLREIARFAPRNAPVGAEALDAFHRIVMARPNDIRNRLPAPTPSG